MARSSVSIVLPVKGEPLDWIQDICNVATWEASDIFIVVSRDDDPISMKPGGSFERVRVLQQGGDTKSDALNMGLAHVRSELVCFVDADVILRGGEISAAREVLEGGEDFVSAGYGNPARPNPFPVFGFASGWFLAARVSVLRDLGGFPENFVEDAALSNVIKRSGRTIARLPFNVELRRAPRNPIVKAFERAVHALTWRKVARHSMEFR